MKTIGVFGPNGIVGRLMIKCLGRIQTPFELKTFGRDDKPSSVDIAILCTEDDISERLARELKDKARFIIDMSAKFRMEEGVPLVIPEINADAITKNTQLIASPNCTVTGLVMALNPLKKKYHLEEVFSSSYQAISGGGKKLIEDYAKPDSFYRENAVPLVGSVKENGFTSEEIKGINEARKILSLPKLKVRSHTVRVPVYAGHGLTITLKAKEDFDMLSLPSLLASQKGVICDGKVYTAKDIAGKDEVYISRLRQDLEDKNIIHFWAVCDNLLKGAALNGSQIAQLLLEKYL